MKKVIDLNINGVPHEVEVHSHRTLLEVLRGDLGYTGTKEGCGLGSCGTCTVIIDGDPVLACLTLAESVRGKDILTIEGLRQKGELHPLQRAFIENGAIQCGFCAPGMILSAKALLDENPSPSEEDIRIGISGNLCRCGAYSKIVQAISSAARATSRTGPE